MRRSVVLDANVLVLFVVGLASRDFIEKHGRCRPFDRDDFDHLTNLVLEAAGIVLLPHVLAETSNLMRQTVTGERRARISIAFQALIRRWGEADGSSVYASFDRDFDRLGLTDVVILNVMKDDRVLVTTDRALSGIARSRGYDALHFGDG